MTGACTLRAAIMEANIAPGLDTIIVPAGTYQIARVHFDDTALGGDLDIADPVTIEGAGSAHTIIDANGSVTVTDIPNAQDLTVTLTNVVDGFDYFSPDVSVSVAVLLGDSNDDRVVNSGDAQQTRNRSGESIDATNFRSDVNRDGIINSGDATLVRSRSGQFVP